MSSTPSLPATELYSPGIKGYVLYVDYQGHPAPLTESFHATASRRLSSTVYRYPLATSQEVDSAYCPQCLTFHDAATAAEIGYCSKVSCRRCPLCLSVASVHTSESTGIQGSSEDDIVCFFQCGLCDWTSKDCDVSVTIPSDGEEHKLGRLELMRAAEDMSTALSDRRKLAMQPIETYHKALTDQWTIYRKQQRQPKTKRVDNDWSLEMLQTKLENLTKTAQDSHNTPDFPNVPNCLQIKHVTIQDILEKLGKADADADDQSAPKVLYPDHVSFLSYHLQSIDAAPLLPLPIPLVLRQSRRCRAELVEGRPGILLKPKLNPLEGDSSLPTGHGQWHRKDSSAIHVIPRVRVVQSHAFCFRAQDSAPEWTRVVFLLKVSNPTLGNVRLRFSESSYSGEVDYWNNGEKSSDSPFFSRLLVDSLSRTIVHAAFRPNLVDSMARSETVDLLSAEDSIIELGGKALRTPAQVLNWSPDNSVDAKDAVGYAPKDAPSMRLIATNAADAWFELSIRDTSSYSVLTTCTVPLALEVDLGNGSWESSLIPVTENVASDKAVFDIVLAWTLN